MPILRGHTFQPSEFVTANSLHALVDTATITNLSTDEFTGEIHGLATATPASIRDGDLIYLHETSVSLAHPTGLTLWSNPNYLIHYKGQWVSLFGADHLETGRFFNNVGSNLDPGEHCQFDSISGSGAVTLTLGINSTGSGKTMCVGGLGGATAVDGAIARIRLIGYGLFNGPANSAGLTWLDTLKHTSTDSQWAKSTVTDDSGFNAMRLNATTTGAGSQQVQPAYFFGGMHFRE